MVHFNSNSPPCSPHRLHSVSVSFTCGKNFNLIFTKKIRNFYSISLKNTKCVQILIRERRMICKMLAITPSKPNQPEKNVSYKKKGCEKNDDRCKQRVYGSFAFCRQELEHSINGRSKLFPWSVCSGKN